MELRIFGIAGLPEVTPGSDLARSIVDLAQAQGTPLQQDDIVVVTQKIVSKAEGRLVELATILPSTLALQWSKQYDRDPRLIEIALQQARRVSRMDRGVLIVETHQGFYCINAGVDASNIPGDGVVALLPEDADVSARKIRDQIRNAIGHQVAVIITDSWGRPWREGLTNVAIGIAGISAVKDYRGTADSYGRELHASAIAIVDEIASAAELVMGKVDMVPVAVVRGYSYTPSDGSIQDLIRDPERDMFR